LSNNWQFKERAECKGILLKKFRGGISLTLRKSLEYLGQLLKSSVNPLLSLQIPNTGLIFKAER
jgi:hypothetical protein